jgi:hypothetical protein
MKQEASVTNKTPRPTSPISRGIIELDKIPDAWVLTQHGGPDGPTLRLKISQDWEKDQYFDENAVTAEVRHGENMPFEPIHSFCISLENIQCSSRRHATWSCLPAQFTSDFKAMLQEWGRIGRITLFGCTDRPRYGASTSYSRDLYELDLDEPDVEG